MNIENSKYLNPGQLIESDNAEICQFADNHVDAVASDRDKAISIFYAVRDGIIYDPYYIGEDKRFFSAAACLQSKRGFCVPKAALMTACLRYLDIPSRVGYASVRNHLTTPKLAAMMDIELYIWHGYSEVFLDGKWIKATPTFNLELCERFKVKPLEFDGRNDSLLQEFDQSGRKHMDYVEDQGNYADVPYEIILDDFRKFYPKWLANGPKSQNETNDFM